MRRWFVTAVSIAALAALVFALPRWTASRIEARREAALEAQTLSIPANLPLCPFPGPERDAFLASAAAQKSSTLWRPVCRIAPLPDRRIVILSASRSELVNCAVTDVALQERISCVLNEPLRALADSRASRTVAWREKRRAIWITSEALAWRDHLIVEQRRFLALTLLTLALAFLAARRTWRTLDWRAACHGHIEADTPRVPRRAEFILLWVLGNRYRSLPGDLSEEFVWKVEHACPIHEANRWYRRQVVRSIAPVSARLLESALLKLGISLL
jgi:hypothetical protein